MSVHDQRSRYVPRWRIGAVLLVFTLAVVSATQAQAAAKQGPMGSLLLSDRFDAPSAQEGQGPQGWIAVAENGNAVEIVSGEVQEADTPPYCVRLADESPEGRPELYRNFSAPAEAGTVSVRVRVNDQSKAPLGIQLRTNRGAFLIALILLPNGKVAYDAGGGNVESPIGWDEGRWMTVRAEWYSDGTVEAYLDNEQVMDRIQYASKGGAPGRLVLNVGYGSGVGREGYVDSIDVVIRSDDSDRSGRGSELTNGAWLGHGYCVDSEYIDLVPSMADKMKNKYNTKYLFVNVGRISDEGDLPDKSINLTKLPEFLASLQTVEQELGDSFHLVEWINGDMTAVDLADAQVRQRIVEECARFVSDQTVGSYVSSEDRAFDGVVIDIEPSGLDEVRFDYLMTLMKEIRQRLQGLDLDTPATIGIAAHKIQISNKSKWYWSPQFFYEAAQVVDYITAMTYNSDMKTGGEYEAWMRDQTRNILDSVSGAHWENDADHPETTRDTGVFIGFPAYPESAHHKPDAEHVTFASLGLNRALDDLAKQQGSRYARHLRGAAIYLHTNGDGLDGYADEHDDWWAYGRHWLGAW